MAKVGNNKQKVFLAVLVALLVAFWVNNLFFKGSGEEPVKNAGGKAFSLGVVPPASMPEVDLGVLDRLNVPVKVSRNIFDPVYRPPVVKPHKTIKPVQAAAGKGTPNPFYKKPPPAPTSREELEYDKATKYLGKFRFVGFIKRKGVVDLFLANDGDYYVTHAGETITEGYYVKAVKPDSIVVADRAHIFDGKEPEFAIPADFEGKEADVITGTTAPYVEAGVGVSGAGGGGQTPPPSRQQRQYQRGPASGGRRSPAQPPRGVTEVQQIPEGGAAQPVYGVGDGGSGTTQDTGNSGSSTQEETAAPGGLGTYSVP